MKKTLFIYVSVLIAVTICCCHTAKAADQNGPSAVGSEMKRAWVKSMLAMEGDVAAPATGAVATNTPPTSVDLPITIPGGFQFFTNFPDTTPDQAKLSLAVGLITLRAAPENYVKVGWNVGKSTNFLSKIKFSLEMYNAPQASGVDSLGAYLGYRLMTSPNYDLVVEGFGRRNFSSVNNGLITPGFSGGVGLDAYWRLLTGNNIYANAAWQMESPTAPGGQWEQVLKAGLAVFF